jgi:hypothetical protein
VDADAQPDQVCRSLTVGDAVIDAEADEHGVGVERHREGGGIHARGDAHLGVGDAVVAVERNIGSQAIAQDGARDHGRASAVEAC